MDVYVEYLVLLVAVQSKLLMFDLAPMILLPLLHKLSRKKITCLLSQYMADARFLMFSLKGQHGVTEMCTVIASTSENCGKEDTQVINMDFINIIDQGAGLA